MKKFNLLLVALMLVLLPAAVFAQEKTDKGGSEEPPDAPVKVQIAGVSKDRMGIAYTITVLTHKPIRSIDLAVTSYSDQGFIGSFSLRWPAQGRAMLSWGRPVECSQRILKKPLAANDVMTVERGVLQVTFTDGSTWTSAGKYGGSARATRR